MTRKCAKCRKEKPEAAFVKRWDSGKLQSWCRECKRAYDRAVWKAGRAALRQA